MKTHLPKLCSCLIVFFFSSSVFADVSFLAEPYLGYGFAGTLSAPSNSQDSYNSFALGARAEATFVELFSLGADFLYLPAINYSPAGSSSNISPNPWSVKLGMVAGVNFTAIPLRFWFVWYPLDNASQTVAVPSLGTVSGKFSGYSYKAGVGYKVLPYLSVNLEYYFTNYSSYTSSDGSTSANFSKSQLLSGNMYMLSVSAPFTFPL